MNSIAIDGPAGSGKSTLTRGLAKKLGWNFLDTGAIYRTIAEACRKEGVSPQDESSVTKVARKAKIELGYKGGLQHMYLNGEDVSRQIRTEEIDNIVPLISTYKGVRDVVVKLQRDFASRENLVVEGRDIGSFVLKDSKNKIYLTASPEERAKRRYLERINRGEQADFDAILKDIKERDHMDMTRKIAPLVKAKDAILIDTSNLTLEEAIDIVYSKVKL